MISCIGPSASLTAACHLFICSSEQSMLPIRKALTNSFQANESSDHDFPTGALDIFGNMRIPSHRCTPFLMLIPIFRVYSYQSMEVFPMIISLGEGKENMQGASLLHSMFQLLPSCSKIYVCAPDISCISTHFLPLVLCCTQDLVLVP
jgi:hypothetical protein